MLNSPWDRHHRVPKWWQNPLRVFYILVISMLLLLVGYCSYARAEEPPIYEFTIQNRTPHIIKYAMSNPYYGCKIWGEVPPFEDHSIRLKEGVYYVFWKAEHKTVNSYTLILTTDVVVTVWSKNRMEAALQLQSTHMEVALNEQW